MQTRAQSPTRPGHRTSGPPMVPIYKNCDSAEAHGPPRPVRRSCVHSHYTSCLNRARKNGLATEECARVQSFRKLGELVLSSACPCFLRELAASMLTPLMKKATGNDARPFPPETATTQFGRDRYTGQFLIMSVRWHVPSSLGSGSHPVSS
jgi:hypothetical protein